MAVKSLMNWGITDFVGLGLGRSIQHHPTLGAPHFDPEPWKERVWVYAELQTFSVDWRALVNSEHPSMGSWVFAHSCAGFPDNFRQPDLAELTDRSFFVMLQLGLPSVTGWMLWDKILCRHGHGWPWLPSFHLWLFPCPVQTWIRCTGASFWSLDPDDPDSVYLSILSYILRLVEAANSHQSVVKSLPRQWNIRSCGVTAWMSQPFPVMSESKGRPLRLAMLLAEHALLFRANPVPWRHH